jgi:CBS domain-containing protein
MTIPKELVELAEVVSTGTTPIITPRSLIGWFGAQRRGVWISARVKQALQHLGLETFPDFEYEWIDGQISVRKATPKSPPEAGTQSDVPAENEAEPTDPTYRIGKLEAANRPPASVAPEAPISRAVTLMMTHDYSQLPVMQGERTVKGILSWASLGQRLAFGQAANTAMDCAVSHHEISADTSLFNAIDGIVRHGYALIRGSGNRITGIVTTTDLSLQFGRLGEPFLHLGEIENYLRRIIGGRLDLETIKRAKDRADTGRTVSGVEDLTFGEYIRLMEDSENWKAIAINLDRDVFLKGLQEVRRIRNDVMHFDPDGPSVADLSELRKWVTLLQRLSNLGVI